MRNVFFRLGLIAAIIPFLAAFPLAGEADSPSASFQTGRILFMIRMGEHENAVKQYQTLFETTGRHDFELLHQMGLSVLEYGSRQNDPESQLLSLYGSSISAHEDVYYILEDSLKSKFQEIQLIAMHALAHFQTDRADQALLGMLGSPSLKIRYEAVHELCKKKHPKAVPQAESLMYKTPRDFWAIYPPLFAMVGDQHSTRVLRRMFNQPAKDTQLALTLSIAKYERDDLLPQIRQLTTQLNFANQEACAFAIGHLKDEQAISKLEKLSTSQYSNVAVAAKLALYRLGRKEPIQKIEEAAKKGDLYAIAALGEIENHPQVLLELLNQDDIQIRINALISLLQQDHPRALELVEELVIRDNRDLGFTSQESPGKTLTTWKVTTSASQLFKENISAYIEHIKFKEAVLEKLRELSEERFISLADKILYSQQNDLVPKTVELLEDLGTEGSIKSLKIHQQQLGAPLVRNYCNLVLYRLNEPGPYGEQLRIWVKNKIQTQFIRMEPFDPWELGKGSYALTPEETSKLLIDSFLAFAMNQDSLGIEALIEAIGSGHAKNKYALAGLLLRATQ